MAQVSHLAFPPAPLDKMKRESTAIGGSASDVSTPRAKRAKRTVVAIKEIQVKDLNPIL